MIASLSIGIGIMITLVVIWFFVQHFWRDEFREMISDEDVLAERRSCGNCGCKTICIKEKDIHSIDK